MVVSLADLRAGKTSDNTSDTPSSGIVRLSDLRNQSGPSAASINSRGAAEADEQWQVAHQWDNNPEAQAIINPPAQPQGDNRNGVEKTLDYIFKENPISKALNYIPAKIAEYAVPDAPMINQNGIVPGTNARQQYANENPVLSSGNATFDKIGDVAGQFIGPMVGTMGTGAGNLPAAAEGVLSRLGVNFGEGLGGKIAKSATEGALVGAPLNAAATLTTSDPTLGQLGESAALGAGLGAGLGALGKYAGTKLGQALDNWRSARNPQPEQIQGPLLGLPEPRSVVAQRRGILEPNNDPMSTPYTFPLPEASPQTVGRVNNLSEARNALTEINSTMNQLDTGYQKAVNDQYQLLKQQLDNRGGVIQGNLIKNPTGDVVGRTGRISENPQWYQEFYADNGKVPSNKDLYNLAKQHIDNGYSDNGVEIPSWAKENDYHTTKEALSSVKSEIEKSINQGSLNVTTSKLKDNVLFAKNKGEISPKVETVPAQRNFAPSESVKSAPLRAQKLQGPTDELKFAQTVKESSNTPPDLLTAMNKEPMLGARTTDILNHKQASDLIAQHGVEGLYGKLMGKKFNFSPSETVAAEMLAKHYGTLGGEANLSKAIELTYKTGKGGREMGQAIQALHMWNKLDESGVLMLGTKQLNKGVEDISKYQRLTTEQAMPLTAAAQRIGSAQDTKNLADEVLSIVTNKQSGEALTDAEKATIKQFQDQVKLINEKGKGILPQPKGAKGNATIKEVSQIEPKARTRDQVVSFLDAKAEQARQRIAAARNIGFAAVNKGNPVADYAIIGASHIAKGVVKLSDFTEQMVKDFGASIKPHIDEVFTKATNIFRKENGLPTVQELDRVVNKAVKDERFSPEDATRFKAWASEIGHYADHNLKTEAIQDLQMAMKDLGDSTLGQKIATVQTGSMLLNPVTMERNVLGNAAQLIGDKVSKIVTVPIDWGMSKLTGERTIVFNEKNQEKFWKNYLVGTDSGYKGVSPNGQLDSYGVHPNVFGKNNPLKYITKLLGASLQGFDHAFYSTAKGEVLATYAEQLGKTQGLSHAEIKAGMKDLIVQLDDRIHELADHAGKYATYQDETMLSKGAEMLRKGLNEATTGAISRALVEKGMPQKYSLEGFGAGDVLIKFAKTPANLVMRGIDYSPIGFIRSMMDLGTYVLKREKFNQHEAVRSLGRAITGTLGLTGMGYILADAGILTGSSSMDKDVRSIQEQSGQGAYKVNWSALSRFFQSGFSYDAAHYQKGDRLMDYQWLQPAAISVAMGVNANKAVKAHKAGDTTAGWQQAGKALLGGIQTVLENPMVQGLSSVIDAGTDIIKKQDPTKLINIAKGVPASFVPTLSNQARTATDNNQRETFNKSLLTEIGNIMANKVPVLSKNLPISYDSLGNAREKLQGGQENTVAQYLTSFFSPAKMTEYKVSPEAKLVLDLMNQSGDANVLPRIASKSFHVSQGKNMKDLKVSLTAEQFSQLQQETGKMVTEKLSQKADYLANPNIALQHKVDAVKKILTDVGTKARENTGTQMGYKKSQIKS